MSKTVVFKSIDVEGDVWSEHAFFFASQDAIENFFNIHNTQFLEIFGNGNAEEIESIKLIKAPSGIIVSVIVTCEDWGTVTISEMGKPYFIS